MVDQFGSILSIFDQYYPNYGEEGLHSGWNEKSYSLEFFGQWPTTSLPLDGAKIGGITPVLIITWKTRWYGIWSAVRRLDNPDWPSSPRRRRCPTGTAYPPCRNSTLGSCPTGRSTRSPTSATEMEVIPRSAPCSRLSPRFLHRRLTYTECSM